MIRLFVVSGMGNYLKFWCNLVFFFLRDVLFSEDIAPNDWDGYFWTTEKYFWTTEKVRSK